jgi:hypothetical protein
MVAVVVAVIALAAIGLRPLLGPASPTQTPSPTIPVATAYEAVFIVLPPTSTLPSKAESDLASTVMAARLTALGVQNFSSATGNAIQFHVGSAGSDDDAVRTVLAATGDVAFVPLPVEDYGDGKLVAVIDQPLPKDEPVLFGWDGIESAKVDSSSPGGSVVVTLRSAAAQAFDTYTSAHVGESFAVLIDGRVALVPTIQAPITGGAVTLTGGEPGSAHFAISAAILVGGELPEAWRGATSPALISRADATSRATDQSPVNVISPREANLEAILIDGAWRAVWNVILDVTFASECPQPGATAFECTVATGYLVVVDAVTGDIVSTEMDPEASPSG